MRASKIINHTVEKLQIYRAKKFFLKNKTVTSFLKENRRFWDSIGAFDSKPNRYIFSEYTMGMDRWALSISISNAILASALNAKVLYLRTKAFDKHPSSTERLIQESFSNCEFHDLDEITCNRKEFIHQEAEKLVKTVRSPEDILDLNYKGVYIGEQVYDSILKYQNASVWKIDDRLVKQLEIAISILEAINTLTEGREIVAGLFTHTTTNALGVSVRGLLARNILVYQMFGGLGSILRYNKTYQSRGQLDAHVTIPKYVLDKVYHERKDSMLTVAQEYVEKRIRGKCNDRESCAAFSKGKKTYTERKSFCEVYQLDSEKPIVFVMLHAMCDDPHQYPQHIFRDYYHWFQVTLEEARKNTSVSWVFKQHPLIKNYPDDANLPGIFHFINDEHICYVDEDIPLSSASIIYVADAVVTSSGTAVLEFSCFGIPGIIGCKNNYSGKGICHEAETETEYRSLLKKIGLLKKLEKKVQEKACIYFYLMYEELIQGFIQGFITNDSEPKSKVVHDFQALEEITRKITHEKQSYIGRIEKMRRFITKERDNRLRVEAYMEGFYK